MKLQENIFIHSLIRLYLSIGFNYIYIYILFWNTVKTFQPSFPKFLVQYEINTFLRFCYCKQRGIKIPNLLWHTHADCHSLVLDESDCYVDVIVRDWNVAELAVGHELPRQMFVKCFLNTAFVRIQNGCTESNFNFSIVQMKW